MLPLQPSNKRERLQADVSFFEEAKKWECFTADLALECQQKSNEQENDRNLRTHNVARSNAGRLRLNSTQAQGLETSEEQVTQGQTSWRRRAGGGAALAGALAVCERCWPQAVLLTMLDRKICGGPA